MPICIIRTIWHINSNLRHINARKWKFHNYRYPMHEIYFLDAGASYEEIFTYYCHTFWNLNKGKASAVREGTITDLSHTFRNLYRGEARAETEG